MHFFILICIVRCQSMSEVGRAHLCNDEVGYQKNTGYYCVRCDTISTQCQKVKPGK